MWQSLAASGSIAPLLPAAERAVIAPQTETQANNPITIHLIAFIATPGGAQAPADFR